MHAKKCRNVLKYLKCTNKKVISINETDLITEFRKTHYIILNVYLSALMKVFLKKSNNKFQITFL